MKDLDYARASGRVKKVMSRRYRWVITTRWLKYHHNLDSAQAWKVLEMLCEQGYLIKLHHGQLRFYVKAVDVR